MDERKVSLQEDSEEPLEGGKEVDKGVNVLCRPDGACEGKSQRVLKSTSADRDPIGELSSGVVGYDEDVDGES